MVVKVYVSGMSGNKEVKKRQQRVLMILDSKSIKYDVIDITEPGKEAEKERMQGQSISKGATVSDPNPRHPLPPQLFYDDEYCGDYDQFDLANEVDTLEQFLKLSPAEITPVSNAEIELNGDKKEEHPVEEKVTDTDPVDTATSSTITQEDSNTIDDNNTSEITHETVDTTEVDKLETVKVDSSSTKTDEARVNVENDSNENKESSSATTNGSHSSETEQQHGDEQHSTINDAPISSDANEATTETD